VLVYRKKSPKLVAKQTKESESYILTIDKGKFVNKEGMTQIGAIGITLKSKKETIQIILSKTEAIEFIERVYLQLKNDEAHFPKWE
jgi:hypothetical protein